MAENTPPPFNRADIVRCGTTEYMRKMKLADPELSGRLKDYESQLQSHIKANTPKPEPTPNKPDEDTICFDQFKGQTITQSYNGVSKQWKLYSDANGKFCYRVILA